MLTTEKLSEHREGLMDDLISTLSDVDNDIVRDLCRNVINRFDSLIEANNRSERDDKVLTVGKWYWDNSCLADNEEDLSILSQLERIHCVSYFRKRSGAGLAESMLSADYYLKYIEKRNA
jgi:hypothetical protein